MITDDRANELWHLLDEARGRVDTRLLAVVRWLREQNEEIDAADLLYLHERLEGVSGSFELPPSVARAFAGLLQSREARTVFDPCGRLGLLGAWLASTLSLDRVDVVTPSSEARELVEPLELSNLYLHQGTIEDAERSLGDEFDAIVGLPPLGMKRESREVASPDGPIRLSDESSLLMIASLASRLSQSGVLAFVVPPRFAWERNARSVRRNLPHLGLHLTGLLRFRSGTFAATSVAFDLAIIERVDRDGLFVAEVPDEDEAQAQLMARLHGRTEGPTATQGRIVAEKHFRGLNALAATERARKLATGQGLQAVPFKKAVSEVRAPRRSAKMFERCTDDTNAVYLPEMALTKATTRQEDLPERLKSYLQLIVDRGVVLPEYLALQLNTPLGHAIREAARSGTTIPRIKKSNLEQGTLYLPPLPQQLKALEGLAAIQGLRNELAELESRVWEKPRGVAEVLAAVGKVNHEDRFHDWLESLPFPLASILRSYHALDRTDKEKYERLLHFFEALAAFCATIHLSAFHTIPAQWESRKMKIGEKLDEQHLRFERATFGLWRVVTEVLAGELRTLLNGNSDEQAQGRALYRVAELEPLKILCSKTLLSVLQQANNHRNRWSGHGGAVSPVEAAKRHATLRGELNRLRECFGTTFLRYQLLEPREAEILPGPVYRCTVRRVMGSNPQFEHETAELTTPAITGGLYLHNPGHNQALELMQFVQVRYATQPACYFFNSLDKSGSHLVSYHFADKSEVLDKSEEVKQLLAELQQGGR